MWKVLSEWLLAFLNMARELQEHRTNLRELEQRTRDLEEAIKLLAQEQRHSRDIAQAEREKLMLLLQPGQQGARRLPRPRKRK